MQKIKSFVITLSVVSFMLSSCGKYDHTAPFYDGLAVVIDGDEFGIIDESGKEIIACDFDRIEGPENGVFLVRKDEKYGFIDKTGRVITGPKYQIANNFSEGRALVKTESGYAFLDLNGKEVITLPD